MAPIDFIIIISKKNVLHMHCVVRLYVCKVKKKTCNICAWRCYNSEVKSNHTKDYVDIEMQRTLSCQTELWFKREGNYTSPLEE